MLRSLTDLVLPSLCVVCGRGATAFCRACREGVAPIDSLPFGPIEVRVAGAYDGALRTAVLAFKSGRRDVGTALADFVAQRWTAPEGIVLVPVPTAPARRDRRGFDQAVFLARELGRHGGVPALAALRRVGSDSQNGRPRAARLEATGRFAVVCGRGLLGGARAVVVDDVVTTGATLRDAAATLARAGIEVAGAVAIARAFPRQPAAAAASVEAGPGL